MPRLFTALRLPGSIGLELSLLRGGLNGARWIDPENYHVTLSFFGDLDRHAANDLDLAFSAIDRYAFDLRIERLDVFGGEKPRALFAALEANATLMELQGEIERIARRHGVAPDRRKFTPHVTLARLSGTASVDVARFIHARGGYRSRPFSVNRFHLLSSKSSIGGGPYLSEAVYPLRMPEWEGEGEAEAETGTWRGGSFIPGAAFWH